MIKIVIALTPNFLVGLKYFKGWCGIIIKGVSMTNRPREYYFIVGFIVVKRSFFNVRKLKTNFTFQPYIFEENHMVISLVFF